MIPGILEMVKRYLGKQGSMEFYFSLSSGKIKISYTEVSLWRSICLHHQWSLMQPAPDMSFAVQKNI